MFRDATDGDRDMKILNWRIGGGISEAKKLGNGSWHLEACPMDGGGIASEAGTTVTAWRREDTIYLDRPGEPETPLGTGKDVSLALTGDGPRAIWTGASGVEFWSSYGAKPISLAAQGAFPTVVARPDGSVLAAWEAPDGNIVIERVPEGHENTPAVRGTY
jgi:hypothetical protein